MQDHRALGLAGRARGVHHIGEVRRQRPGGGSLGALFRDRRPIRIEADEAVAGGRKQRAQLLLRQQHARAGVADHEGEPLRRIGRVERHIGAAGLPYRKQRDDELRHALHADADERLAADAQPAQMMRDLVRAPVELAIAEPPILVHHRDRLGRGGGLTLEQLVDAKVGDGGAGRVPPIEHALAIGFAEPGAVRRQSEHADHLLHDLVRAGVDALHPAVGPHAGDRIFGHVAVAAVQLDAFVDDPALRLGQPILRHRARDLVERAVEEALDAVVEEDAADARLGLAFGELEARVLELDQRPPAGHALLDVLGRDRDRALGRGDGAGADRQALVGQLLHHLEEALALGRADEVCGRHADVVEEQLAGVLRVHADLLERAPDRVAGKVLRLDDEKREALHRRDLGVGLDREADEAGVPAIADEGLRAVDDVGVAVAAGRRRDGGEVRAGAGLAHGDRADELA